MRATSVFSRLALTLTVLLGLGCAQLLAAFEKSSPHLEARGPAAVFGSIDAAAVDALTYAYLEGVAGHDTKRMRGGTIYFVEGGYSYGEIQVAGPLAPHRVRTPLTERDVARFLIYYRTGRHDVDRANERPSQVDRRSVRFLDPMHRPLYILHPSLVVRVYSGEQAERVDVADLHHPGQALMIAGE
jgi:hypothetical protein